MSRYSEHAKHWTLDPAIDFLNHGSFGATPRVVLEKQAELRALIEREPVKFLARELEGRLDEARKATAAFVGAKPESIAFVTNATAGVNTVLRSLKFKAGDELLVTNHEYNASRNALNFAAAQSGATVVVAEVPFPLRSADEIVEAILRKVTPRTRLLLVDHITSQTGLIFPIERLQRELSPRGIDLLVDGAHGPGMVPLDLEALGVAYYTGNFHKWVCAPKGAALLYVRPDRQAALRPLSISHGANSPRTDRSRFRIEFDWTGTDDPTAVLCVPESIEVIGKILPGGWPEVMRANHELAVAGRKKLCEALGIEEPTPPELIGSLASVPIQDGSSAPPKSPLYEDALQQMLFEKHAIEVPIMPWPAPPKRLLRISAQLYNALPQYEALAAALRELGIRGS